jgi:hypothetical protein
LVKARREIKQGIRGVLRDERAHDAPANPWTKKWLSKCVTMRSSARRPAGSWTNSFVGWIAFKKTFTMWKSECERRLRTIR